MSTECIYQQSPAQEKITVEVSVGSLYPILPQQTGRYNVAQRVRRTHAVVGAGMFMSALTPAPQYLPQQWSAYTHPEGQVYFARNGEGSLRVVTDSYLYKPEVADKLVSWVKVIEKEAAAKDFSLPESVELYVQIEEEDCNYYFADHVARTLFWLDDYETSSLGLLPVVSSSHLKFQLEEHYWAHVEYHSTHALGFHSSVVEEAISHLIQGCGDHMTSDSSTFPYSLHESKGFLDILVPARGRPVDARILSLAARILNVIACNRYFTHYGQEQARLCRDNSILEDEDESEPGWTSTLASAVTLKAQDFFSERMNTIFTDNYVYAADWKKFVSQSLGKWKFAFAQSVALLALHMFAFFLPVAQPLAMASAGALGLSIVFSAILIHQHMDMEESTAHEGHAYLAKHKAGRFQRLALSFALPQALSLWGLFFMSAQVFTFLSSTHVMILFADIILVSIAFVCRSIYLKSRRTKATLPEHETTQKSIV